MNTCQLVKQCLEGRGLLQLFLCQKRFRSKTQRIVNKPDSQKNKVKERVFKNIKAKQRQREAPKPKKYDADKPLDDIWITTNYPEPKFSIREIITRHKEYAQPAMYDLLESRIIADIDINLKTKKQTKFLSSVSDTIVPPNVFEIGVKKRIIAICSDKQQIEKALEMGAFRAGEADMVKMMKDGVIKRSDFDHLVSVPGYEKEWASLRGGGYKDKAPSVKAGTIGEDIEKMLNFFLNGLSYSSVKQKESEGNVKVPFGQLKMPIEQLEENFYFILENIYSKKPAGQPGNFFKHLSITSPPSPFRYILRDEDYVLQDPKNKGPKKQVEEDAKDTEEQIAQMS